MNGLTPVARDISAQVLVSLPGIAQKVTEISTQDRHSLKEEK